jgi:hypothetical protein
MRPVLITSTLAMIAAGIYGAADMGHEINRGTMIDYERSSRPLARVAMRYELDETDAPLKEKIAAYTQNKKEEEEKQKRERTAPFSLVSIDPGYTLSAIAASYGRGTISITPLYTYVRPITSSPIFDDYGRLLKKQGQRSISSVTFQETPYIPFVILFSGEGSACLTARPGMEEELDT